MPHKSVEKKGFVFASWVNAIEDPCLYDIVVEAFIARNSAERTGAEEYPDLAAELASGDATMEQVRYGRFADATACKKASTALRKFTQAYATAFRRRNESGQACGTKPRRPRKGR